MTLAQAHAQLDRAKEKANTAADSCIELSAIAAQSARMISLRFVQSAARQLAAAAIAAADTASHALSLIRTTNAPAAEELVQSAAHAAELAASAVQGLAEAAKSAAPEISK